MGWRVARSLDVLLSEIDAVAPHRSTASDGSIGDTAHSAEASDHNPNAADVVCARDYTHDPKHGADMTKISDYLLKHRHRCLKYLIFNRRIAGDWTGWKWHPYTGANPHTHHMHVSVGRGADEHSTGPYDDKTPWGVADHFGDDMDLSDKVALPDWVRENFDDLGETISVRTALGSGYGHARSTKAYVLRLEEESRERDAQILAAVQALNDRLDALTDATGEA